MRKTFYFPTELIGATNFMGEIFTLKHDGEIISAYIDCMLYKLTLFFSRADMDFTEFVISDIKKENGVCELICESYGNDAEKGYATLIEEKNLIEIFDTRPADPALCSPYEIIEECAHGFYDISKLFGGNFLDKESAELASAANYIEFVCYPEQLGYAEKEQLKDAATYTAQTFPELSEKFSYFAKKKGKISLSELKQMKKALILHKKTDFDTEKFMALCAKANEGCADNGHFEKEKYSAVKNIITSYLTEKGYFGAFPNFTKEEKYIRFGLGNEFYENEKGEFYYDISVAFGINGEKPLAFKDNFRNREFLNLPVLCLSDDELEEKLSMYIDSVDKILDGKDPDKEFFSIPDLAFGYAANPAAHIIRMVRNLLIVLGTVSAAMSLYLFLKKAPSKNITDMLLLSGLSFVLSLPFIFGCKKRKLLKRYRKDDK